MAVEAVGPVLDLAGGDGRVSLALAVTGAAVTGLDLSEAMLTQARRQATAQGLNVNWVQADLRSFNLATRFALALLPYNGLQQLHSAADLEAFFACLRRQLLPGGRFALDLHLPQPRILARDPDEWFGVEGSPQAQGWQVQAERSAYDPLTQVLTQTWRLAGPEGASRDLSLSLRQFYPQELQALLKAQGFALQAAWGGFHAEPLDPSSLRQVLLCTLI